MSNDYYNPTYDFQPRTLAESAKVDAELAAVQAGFAKLPGLSTLLGSSANFITAGGTANALTASLGDPWTTYTGKDGNRIAVRIITENTGAATMSVDGLAYKALLRNDGDALQAGDLQVGGVYDMVYDETAGQFRVIDAINGVLLDAEAAATAAAATQTEINNVYLGSQSSPPTTDGEGNPLDAGDAGAWYIDSTTGVVYVWTGTEWISASRAVVEYQRIVATAGQTIVTLANAYTTSSNSVRVFLNGVAQFVPYNFTETDSTTITFTVALEEGDILDVFTNESASYGFSASASSISYNNATSGLTAVNMQDAIDELEDEIDAVIAGEVTAADVTYSNATSGLTATDAQAAIDEVEGRVDTAETNISAKLNKTGDTVVTVNEETEDGDDTDGALNWAAFMVFTRTLAGNVTFSFTNVPTTDSTKRELFLTNGGTYVVTWPASNFAWVGGEVPTLGTVDRIILSKYEGDTTVYAEHRSVTA